MLNIKKWFFLGLLITILSTILSNNRHISRICRSMLILFGQLNHKPEKIKAPNTQSISASFWCNVLSIFIFLQIFYSFQRKILFDFEVCNLYFIYLGISTYIAISPYSNVRYCLEVNSTINFAKIMPDLFQKSLVYFIWISNIIRISQVHVHVKYEFLERESSVI